MVCTAYTPMCWMYDLLDDNRGDDAAKVFRTRGPLGSPACIIILRWWVRRGERKISKFILFTFYISWHGVLYTTRRVRAYETIRWQRTHCCNTRLPLHARDVILPFVYNYSKTISSVCNNNIIFSAVKIISAECIAQPAGRSVPAASPSVRAFGRVRTSGTYALAFI